MNKKQVYQKNKHIFLILSLFLLFFTITTASAQQSNHKITLSFEKTSLLQAMKKVESVSQYTFFYDRKVIQIDRKVSLSVKDASIQEVLKKMFTGTDITFEISNRQIVLLPVTKPNSSKKLVTGVVSVDGGEPAIGATVMVKGETIGTITDVDGKFSIEAPLSGQLQFSYVGYVTKTVSLNGKADVRVTLSEDNHNLEEVVVVGYGSMKKKDLTGSVVGLRAEDISQTKSSSFVNAMQGKLAGVQISSQSGELGASTRISIRGANSVYGSSLPLYVIDGVQIDVNSDEMASSRMGNGSQMDPMSSINPADIESIEVLKDASATAIYGSRGANGVVIVTTRSGKVGKSRVNYDGYISFGQVTKKIDVLGASDFIDYRREIDGNCPLFFEDSNEDGAYNELDDPRDPYSNPVHDWQDEMLRTAVSHNHNLSLDGGTEALQYSGSVGYSRNEGIIINNDYERITTRLKIDYKKDRLKMGLNMNVSYSQFNGASQSGGEGGAFNGVVQSLVTARPIEIYIPEYDNMGTYVSPISMLKDAYKNTSLMRSNLNAYGEYRIMDGLTLNISVGGFLSSSKGKEFYGRNTEWGAGDHGRAMIAEQRASYISNSNQLTYQKNFGKSSLNAMVAFELNHYNFESFSVDNANFLDESTGVDAISKGNVLKGVNSYRGVNNRVSYLGRIYYDLLSRYLFTASIRADGSDKFGKGNQYGYFPSIAFAWRLSEEKFMKNQHVFDNLKFRLSYGQTGNERIASYQYMANMENSYYNGVLGLSPSTLANPNLKWETTIQYNAGLDMGFLNNRVQLNIDYYKKITNDMLMPAAIPSQTGYSSQWKNIGKVHNEGVELQLSTINLKNKDFQWSTDFNISHNKNTVKDLGGVDFVPVAIGGGWLTNVGRVMVGHDIGTAYGYVFDGIYQMDEFTWQNGSDPDIPFTQRNFTLKPGVISVKGTNVKPGSYKFKNLDGSEDNVVDENDQTIISHSSPKFFGGMNNTFRYKNFELSVFLSGSFGNEVFNESKFRLSGGIPLAWQNLSKDFWDNRWTPENPTNSYGTFSVDTRNTTSLMTNSYYVEDASYIKLKSVSLSYTIPASILKKIGLGNVTNAKVYATGDNLYTWTNYTGFDPEVDSGNALLTGFDRVSYPRTRSYILGVNVTF